MDKTQSHKIVRETFEGIFNKDRFVYFCKNLLNTFDASRASSAVIPIPTAYKDFISKYERVGTYTDPAKNRVDLLVVYLQRGTSLERARTAQRNFVARYLKEQNQRDAGLVAFVSPTSTDWRFSLVKMDYKFAETKGGRVKVEEEFTPARRWSFLVGENENSHTAQGQLAPVVQEDEANPTLSELEDAFNIEKVTDEFFEKYRDLFLRTNETLKNIVDESSIVKAEFVRKHVRTADFSKQLLGQIIFLYFLQKKGWFGVGRDAIWGSGPRNFIRQLFEGKHGNYNNFFNDILEPLFYEALAKERDDDYYARFNCKIPFLNGGLFDPVNDYDWIHADILLPDTLFSNSTKTAEGDSGDGILDIFDRYNFTVKEDEPLEREVAVDPEMLGKVFENLLEVKDRKSKGTYYTPREIVHYMCQQSLINYLVTDLDGVVTRKDINQLITGGEAIDDIVERRSKHSELADGLKRALPERVQRSAAAIDEGLANIKVCDPAIGSGAFPVGMMSEIVRARCILSPCIGGDGRTSYNFKRHCIQNSLYGVDIDPGAVEIAKLRLWLSLVVDEDDIKQIKPLPNLDYKIMQGNSLLEDFNGIQLFDEKMIAPLPIDGAIEELKEQQIELQKQYFSLHSQGSLGPNKQAELSNALNRIATELKRLANRKPDMATNAGLFEAYSEANRKAGELKQLHREFFGTTQRQRKEVIKKRITALEWDLIEATLKEQGKTAELDKLDGLKKSDTRPFFLWKLYFAEVFQEEGGFDVVIANPPYVDSERMTKEMPEQREEIAKAFATTKGNWDLYIPFWERGFKLLSVKGCAVFITPNKWLAIGYGQYLRKCLREFISLIANCDRVKVFEAGNSPIIVFVDKPSGPPKIAIDTFGAEYALGERLEIESSLLDKDSWGFLLSSNIKLLLKLERQPKGTQFYQCENPFTVGEAYEVKPLITDVRSAQSYRISTHFKFVNTGTIERYYSLWGKSATTYLKDKYMYPVIKRDAFLATFPKRYSQMNVSKLLISGMRHFECLFDDNGSIVAGKSTVILKSKTGKDYKFLMAVLNSRLTSFYIKESYGVLGIDGGINFTADLVENLPIPEASGRDVDTVTRIVSDILETTSSPDYLSDVQMQAKVAEREQAIDQLIYKLYDLTRDEVKIVEGITRKS